MTTASQPAASPVVEPVSPLLAGGSDVVSAVVSAVVLELPSAVVVVGSAEVGALV